MINCFDALFKTCFFVSTLILLRVINADLSSFSKPVPLVIWHGMGDSCCNPNSIGRFKRLIEENVKNVYILSIQIGNTILDVIIL